MAKMNALFSDVFNTVMGITKHPEMATETINGIQQKTLEMHRIDDFAKDEETRIIELAIAPVFQLSIPKTQFPYCKQLHRIAIEGIDKPLSKLGASDLFLMAKRQNCWLETGANVVVKCALKFNAFYATYSRHPDVTEEHYDSWIAREHKFAIVDAVCGRVFGLIGDTQKATFYNNAVENTHKLEIIKANIVNLDGFSNVLSSGSVD